MRHAGLVVLVRTYRIVNGLELTALYTTWRLLGRFARYVLQSLHFGMEWALLALTVAGLVWHFTR